MKILLRFCAALALSAVARSAAPADARLAVPGHGAYLGAFVDFGDTEDSVTLPAIEHFERLIEKRVAIIASSSYWGEQSFPAANLELIARHRAVPLIFWSPWDKPYEQLKGPDRFSLTSILAGKWDAYIDRWAAGAKAFGRPFLVSLCNEMNGDWFPWSGCYYGGAKPLPGGEFEGPAEFKRAWRYIVDRVRAQGGTNVLWVFQVNNYSDPIVKWNAPAQYYPGSKYVDWLGLSIYGKQERFQDHWMDFDEDLLEEPYVELNAVDPSKPIMVAEFGVGEFPDIGDKAKWIAHAFASMSSPQYPQIKAAIYWHERWQNLDGTYSNLRVNSSLETLNAFRNGVKSPFWLAAPVWQSPTEGALRVSANPL
ncbi:MAG: glycosyl hydrolase [Terrimicrobiaceae bacterium]|nr:glycosyl hydrolase [Terrimicrobiaceae bacterium]